MPGAVKDSRIDENGDIIYDDTSPAASTPMSKATPMSKNNASPSQLLAAGWTNSQARRHGGPSSAQPSQSRQYQYTQKAKKSFFDTESTSERDHDPGDDEDEPLVQHAPAGRKGLFDTDSIRNRGNRPEDDDDDMELLQPISTRVSKGIFESDSTRGPGDDQQDDDVDPFAPPSAQVPTKKGTFSLSSAATSVADSAEDTSPQTKLSTNMRGKSALDSQLNLELKKPIEKRKHNRKSTGKTQLLALDLEEDDGVDQVDDATVDDATADPFHIANIPRSRGASPGSTKPQTRNVPKKRPAGKPSNPPAQDKKPLTKPSKPSPSHKNPAKPRQKAKHSVAADKARETASTESSEGHQDDNDVVNTAAKVSQPNGAEILATKTKAIGPTRAKGTAKQPSRARDSESVYTPSGSESADTGMNEDDGEDDDEYVQECSTRTRAKATRATKKPPQATKKRPQARNITNKSKAPKEVAKATKSNMTNKAKEKVGADSGDNDKSPSEAASLSKPLAETSQSSMAPSKKAVVAKASPAKKTSAETASSASMRNIATRGARCAPEAPNSEGSPDAGSSASRPAPRPTTRRQPKSQPTFGSEDNNSDQADKVSPGAGSTKPRVTRAQGHQRSQQTRQAAGEPNESKGTQAQGKTLAKSSNDIVQNISNNTEAGVGLRPPVAVKDRQRKALIIPFGADGPRTNGKSQSKRPAGNGDENLGAEGPAISPESNSSNVAQAKRSPTADRRAGFVDENEVETANVQPNCASHTQLASDSHTKLRSSRVKHTASAVGCMVETSEQAESSKQQRTHGSRASQRPAAEAPRKPSVIPEEDEEQDAFLSSDVGRHQNIGAQTKVAGEISLETAADDDDGIHFGDDPPDMFDRIVTPDALDNPENTSDSASALPTHLVNPEKTSDTLSPDQVQGFRRVTAGQFPDEQPLYNDQSKAGRQLRSQFANDLEPSRRARKRPSTGPEVGSEEPTIDSFPSRHQHGDMSLDFSDHQHPSISQSSSMMNKQPTHNGSRHPFAVDRVISRQTQSQQPSTMKVPARRINQQPSTIQQPTTNKQRLEIKQHTTSSKPVLFDQPAWKQQSVMSQQTVPNRHFLVQAEERQTNQVGGEWQTSLEPQATADQPPMKKSFSQPGAGIQSAKSHIQGLSSDFRRPPKRTRLNGPVHVAEPLLPAPVKRPYLSANGFSSDDVFAPKRATGAPEIDINIVGRLRGMAGMKPTDTQTSIMTDNVDDSGQLSNGQNGAWNLDGHVLRAAPSKDTSPGSCQEESPEQPCASDLWRQSLMNRRAQRTVAHTNDAETDEDHELEMYEGVGDVMQKIVTGVLRSLKAKEAAIHDIVKDYQIGGARVVNSIVATHVEERRQLIEEHEENRLKYIRVLEDARSKFRAIGEAADTFDVDSIPFW